MNYAISSAYGPRARGDGFHDGVDIACPQGTGLFAPFDCWVEHDSSPAYGFVVNLYEVGGWRSIRWAHLSERWARTATKVEAGVIVALSGGEKGHPGAGNSTGAHLHMEVRIRGDLTDPEDHPELLEATFDPEVFAVMTKDEIRDIIEQELGQRDIRLGKALKARAEGVSDPQVKRVLNHYAAELINVGEITKKSGS